MNELTASKTGSDKSSEDVKNHFNIKESDNFAKSKIRQNHDAFYCGLLESKELVTEILQTQLSESFRSRVDYDSLEIVSSDYYRHDLKSSRGDVLYRAIDLAADEKRYLYFLMEHQSSIDYWMPRRLLEYTLRLFEREIEEHNGNQCPLPLVFQFVLYSGKGAYSGPRSLLDYFDLEDHGQANNLFLADYKLMGLSKLSGVDIPPDKELTFLEAVEIIARYREEAEVIEYVPNLIETMFRMRADGKFGNSMVAYLLSGLDEELKKPFFEQCKQAPTELRGKTMSIADALIAEGLQQGIGQGIEQGKRQSVLEMAKACLREGVEPNLVSKLTGLNSSDIEQLAGDIG